MVRRAVIQAHGVHFEEQWRAFEDWDFVTQVARVGALGAIASVLVTVDRRGSDRDHQWSPANVIQSAPLMLSKYEGEFRTRGVTRARVHTQAAVAYQRQRNYVQARRSWQLAWTSSPRHVGLLRRHLVACLNSLRPESTDEHR
jgi:hypothetical protein